MKVLPTEKKAYDDFSLTKVVSMGPITELTTYQKKIPGPPIRKIDKDNFLDLRSGELREYQHTENRSENLDGVRKTLANIRAIVNTNVTVPENVRWVTLTYAENMTDTERLYQDFRKFWQKFKRWCKANDAGQPEYITVQEPQGRGAWHIHAFFIWDKPAPFIDNNQVMEKLWGHGFTKTKSLQDCDNIGAYFGAYLADMPLDEVKDLPDREKEKALTAGEIMTKSFADGQDLIKDKKFIKGARLIFYPSGMNILRKSKGIKSPDIQFMPRYQAEKKVSSDKLTFSSAYEIIDDNSCVKNTITKAYYNSKRKEKQQDNQIG